MSAKRWKMTCGGGAPPAGDNRVAYLLIGEELPSTESSKSGAGFGDEAERIGGR
jgi:hypothetical protein